ncbi:MAG: hypothetical protein MUE78_09325, partial [Ilumatobacteraceae bacterium]|nr:hypothetical protein [Ilumatobacteraceae bacterium]
ALTDWTEAEPYVELGLGPAAPADAYEARSILAINLGMAAFFAGRWTEAVELYEEGRVNAQTMGNVTGAALASMNAAEVLLDQGHLERADAALGEVRRVLAAAGYAAALSYAELLMGVLALRQGDLERARTTLGACRRAFREGSMLLYALETELRLAEVDVCAGDLAAAEAIVDQVLVEAPALSRRAVVVARAQRLLGAIAHARGDSQAGVEHLRDAADTCRSGSLRFELAVTLAALDEVVDDPDARADAAAIFDELGVTERGRCVGLVRPISG